MSASPERLLVVRLGSMGDIIHTLPAVATLRRAFPAATIGWAVERRWASLLSSSDAISAPRSPLKPLVDIVHIVDTLAWRRALLSAQTWREVRQSLHALRNMKYEIAIDFQGAWKSAIVAQLSRAPRRVGFMRPREKPATLFYTHQVDAAGRHIVEQNISLAEQVSGQSLSLGGPPLSRPGLPRQGGDVLQPPNRTPDFPLPCDPSAERAIDEQLRAHGLCSFVIVNPGAGWGAKCWPAERYAEVVRALAVHGLRAIVNFGPGEEQLARDVEHAVASSLSSGGPPLSPPVLGRQGGEVPATVAPPLSSPGLRRQGGGVPLAIAMPTTVAELIALCRRARLCIGGDTGPIHLASALGVPVVALYGPTDPARTGPYSNRVIVLRSDRSRTTASHQKDPEEGLLHITAGEVTAAARALLAQSAESRR